MSLIAILSARLPARIAGEPDAEDSLAALLPFGGAAFVEHQARQVVEAGARLVLIHADAAPPALVRVAERIDDWPDVTAAIVREMPGFATHIGRDDRVLTLADSMLIPQAALAALAAGAAPRLLVAPHVAATQWLERIDAQDGWAGAALVEGGLVLDTIDMLGEWDLMSTLVRAAVQKGAGRLVISPGHAMHGELARIEGRADADRALQAMTSAPDTAPDAPARPLARLMAPVARVLASILVRRQIAPRALLAPALGTGVLGLGLAAFGWPATGLILALFACALRGTAREAGRILLHRPLPLREAVTLDGMMLGTLAVVAIRAGEGSGFAIVAALMALGALLAVAPPEGRRIAPGIYPCFLRLDLPTALLVMLAGAAAGLAPLALGVIGLFSLGELGLQGVSRPKSCAPKSSTNVAKP